MLGILVTIGWFVVMTWTHRFLYRRWTARRLGNTTTAVALAILLASLPIVLHLVELAVGGTPTARGRTLLIVATTCFIAGLVTTLFVLWAMTERKRDERVTRDTGAQKD